MKKVFLIFQLLLVVMLAQAQMMNPVKFTSSLKTDGSAVAEIVFSGKIQPGWHVYSTGLGGDGPISASFNVNTAEGKERKNLWFAGFYPAEDPQYTIVVLQDGQTQAAVSSAAVFAQLCTALHWLG